MSLGHPDARRRQAGLTSRRGDMEDGRTGCRAEDAVPFSMRNEVHKRQCHAGVGTADKWPM